MDKELNSLLMELDTLGIGRQESNTVKELSVSAMELSTMELGIWENLLMGGANTLMGWFLKGSGETANLMGMELKHGQMERK